MSSVVVGGSDVVVPGVGDGVVLFAGVVSSSGSVSAIAFIILFLFFTVIVVVVVIALVTLLLYSCRMRNYNALRCYLLVPLHNPRGLAACVWGLSMLRMGIL